MAGTFQRTLSEKECREAIVDYLIKKVKLKSEVKQELIDNPEKIDSQIQGFINREPISFKFPSEGFSLDIQVSIP